MTVCASLVIIIMFLIMNVKVDEIDISVPPDNSDASDQIESSIIYAPEPSSDPTLVQCTSNITLYCAAEIIENDELYTIPFEAKCCKQLVKMGKVCNDLIVQYLVAEFAASKTQKRSVDMHRRSDNLWRQCLDVVNYGESSKELQPIESSVSKVLTGADTILRAGELMMSMFKSNNGN